MYRFFCDAGQIVDGEVHITGEDVRHIRNVLRMKPGEAAAFDLSGERITFEETTVDGSRTYDVHVKSGSKSVPSLHITLADGVSLSWLHASKENKGFGTLRMLGSDGGEIYHGGLDTIKGRGNTSFTHPGLAADKKSYSIKLEKKAELIAGEGQKMGADPYARVRHLPLRLDRTVQSLRLSDVFGAGRRGVRGR